MNQQSLVCCLSKTYEVTISKANIRLLQDSQINKQNQILQRPFAELIVNVRGQIEISNNKPTFTLVIATTIFTATTMLFSQKNIIIYLLQIQSQKYKEQKVHLIKKKKYNAIKKKNL